MYDILQLKSKSLEELQSLAAEMGLKSAKSTDKNTLVYDILDEQAISASKNTPERDRKSRNLQQRERQAVRAVSPRRPRTNRPSNLSRLLNLHLRLHLFRSSLPTRKRPASVAVVPARVMQWRFLYPRLMRRT